MARIRLERWPLIPGRLKSAGPWTIVLAAFLSLLFVFLTVRASDQFRWSDWGFGDAQTMLSLRQWEEGGWLSNYFLFVPQGYAKVVSLFDDQQLRQHAHGTCPGSSPRVGPRLRYTHYPAGYLVPYALFFRIGLDSLFAVRMLSIFFSIGALVFMYFLFSRIMSPGISFTAVLFYALTPSFLGYADALANQPLDDLLRFAFMLAVVLSTRAESAKHRKLWMMSAWGLEFLLSLASFDSVFFLYAWVIGWDILEKRGFRWKTYLLYGLAPFSAHSLEFLQNVWYLGLNDALIDIRDAFLLKNASDAAYNFGQSRIVVVLSSLGTLINNLYNPGLLIVIVLGLYIGYFWLLSRPGERELPSVRLLNVLFICGLIFLLVLPHAARMPYEARQMIPFTSVLISGTMWSFLKEFYSGIHGAPGGVFADEPGWKKTLRIVYLMLSAVLILLFWYRFMLNDRQPVYYIPDAKTDKQFAAVIGTGGGNGLEKYRQLRDEVLLAKELRKISTAYEPVYYSLNGFRLFWDPKYVPGYPQVMPITEYYTGSKPVLCFDSAEGLTRDLLYMIRKSPYKFSPVLVVDGPNDSEYVISILRREGVLKDGSVDSYEILGRRALNLSGLVKWGRR